MENKLKNIAHTVTIHGIRFDIPSWIRRLLCLASYKKLLVEPVLTHFTHNCTLAAIVACEFVLNLCFLKILKIQANE